MTKKKAIDQVREAIFEMVGSDIVSLAEVRQIFDDLSESGSDFIASLSSLLLPLFESGVEIGHAVTRHGDYVEFIGWLGSSETKIKRAIDFLTSNATDAGFGVWLALRSNVDCYEREGTQGQRVIRAKGVKS